MTEDSGALVGASVIRVGARGLLVGAIAVTVLMAATRAQGPQPTLQVRGRVVSDETGQPLPNARVLVNGTATAVRADLDGRFTIAAQSGATLVVTKAGFVRKEEGLASRSDLTQPFEVRMIRATALAGRVTNEYGEPLPNLTVRVAPAEHREQRDRTTTTDDRGEYRFGGLPPGTYVTGVELGNPVLTVRPPVPGSTSPPSVVVTASGTTYYPGVSDPGDAAPLNVAPGEERVDIDLHLTVGQTVDALMQSVGLLVERTPAPKGGTASIRGAVIDDSGRALPRTSVVLIASDRSYRSTSSDSGGRFEFSSLAAGLYRFSVFKPGFVVAPGSSGLTVTVGADENRDRINVRMVSAAGGGSEITGHIFDEAGEPVSGARVGLLQSRYRLGRRRLVTVNTGRPTDDRGEFRLSGIRDGQYILGASTGDGFVNNNGGYGPTFYPGTGSGAEAQFITVTAGDNIKGLDFSLVTTPAVRVSGKLIDQQGHPQPPHQLNLVARSPLESQMGAIINTDGTFEFRNVPPGWYVIKAGRGSDSPGRERDFVAYSVTVGQDDVSGLILQMPPTTTIKGRVAFDSVTNMAPPKTGIAFTTVPTDFDLAPWTIAVGDVQADGTFEMKGITGIRRLQAATLPTGWMVKSITSDGVDVTDQPLEFGRPTLAALSFEVVLTDRVNSVSGTVTDDRNRGLAGVRIVVFSPDNDRWYPGSRSVRSVETSPDGSFAIAGMPVGSYFIAPAPSFPPGDEGWSEPAFLESLRSVARTISMGEGDSQSVTFRLSSR